MNQKNKAFTLIELLAVIVILAIIALIATPIILNIIEKARKNAFVDTAYGLMDAAKLQYTEGILDHTQTSKSYTFPQSGTDILKFSGNEPQGGTLNIDAHGNIELAIHDGTWCVTKKLNNSKITVEKYDGECTLYTPEKCFTFDSRLGSITKYAIEEEDCGPDVIIPKTIQGKTVLTIGDNAFVSGQLTSVVIPNTVTSIGVGAFVSNKLTSVVIPDSVKTICDGAFFKNQLTSLTIGKNVTIIGKEAFNQNQLPNHQAFIYARNSDGSIDYTTLLGYGGANREQVTIPEGVTTIGDHALNEQQLKAVTLPSTLTTIGSNAFSKNKLTSVVIPSNVTNIESLAFYSNALTNIEIPNSVTSIGYGAFGGNQLTSVTIQGKSSSSDFTYYPSSTPFGWASGYSDSNIIWNG